LGYRDLLLLLTTGLFTVLFVLNGNAQVNLNNADSAATLQSPIDLNKDSVLAVDSILPGQLKESSSALTSNVIYSAKDSIRFDLDGKKMYLFGTADVKYEEIHLEADYIEIDWATNIVSAQGRADSNGVLIGKPVFSEDAQKFDALKMEYNFKTKKGRISEVFTKQGEGYLHGETVKKNDKNEFFVKNGQFTTCNLPGHPHFAINASKIKMIPNDKIITGPANLEIEGLPTPLAVPFGIFPNSPKRSSGIIIPTYGESANLGFFLTDGGYYFGINDYIDAAIRGNIYSRGSWGLSGRTTYNYRYHYNGALDLRFSKILQGDPELFGSTTSKDFFVTWKHNQDAKARPNSRFSASVNAGTNNYNQLNSFNTNTIVANTFQSSISYSKSFPNLPVNFVISANHSQNTATKIITVTAPELQANLNRIFPFKRKNLVGKERFYEKIGITATAQSRNTISLPDSIYGSPGLMKKFNNGVQFQIPLSTSFQLFNYITVTPGINTLYRGYFSSIRKQFYTGTDSLLTDTIQGYNGHFEYNASLNMSTRVYSFLKIGKNTIRHVMTPQVNFRIQPDFSTRQTYYNLEGVPSYYSPYEQGIYGQPSSGKQGTIGLSLNNNFEAKIKSKRDTSGTGLKKIVLLEVFNISTSYNIAADSLNWQNINLNARTKLFKKLDLVYSSSYDLYTTDALGRRINTFEFDKSGKLARNVSTSLALTMTLISAKPVKKVVDRDDNQDAQLINRNLNDYVDFNIPWSLNSGFVLSRSTSGKNVNLSQVLNFSGDVSITTKWKIGFSSGYDFSQRDFSFTSIDIFRDLHCWEMKFNWIPFGFRKSYNFSISVKPGMLQDLKLNRRRQWFDL
jgi:lipopolysaccharide assembly outer membrane protein LptD (OstA)